MKAILGTSFTVTDAILLIPPTITNPKRIDKQRPVIHRSYTKGCLNGIRDTIYPGVNSQYQMMKG